MEQLNPIPSVELTGEVVCTEKEKTAENGRKVNCYQVYFAIRCPSSDIDLRGLFGELRPQNEGLHFQNTADLRDKDRLPAAVGGGEYLVAISRN